MRILLFNAGSSSLKCSVLESGDGSTLASGTADWAGEETRYQFSTANAKTDEVVAWSGPSKAVARILRDLRDAMPSLFSGSEALAAVGHRIVHGGDYGQAMRITPAVRGELGDLSRLAPLHNPPSLEVLDAMVAELPGIPQVACFDTSFHRSMKPEARGYPIPQRWVDQWKIRRYGFHGLSHAYCAGRVAEMLPSRDGGLRLVVCHLGHGCSASAIRDGECVDTTMGFTPLEGLMMATRSGSLDPELVLHLQREHRLTTDEVSEALNKHSGLLGVSGISSDMRRVLESARQGDEQAALAVAMYCHRARQAIAGLAATMGGVDALVFSAGVGENSVEVREKICKGLEFIGITIDARRNRECSPDTDIATQQSPGRVFVIKTREDLTMLRQIAPLV